MVPTKAAAIMLLRFGNIPIQRSQESGGSHGGLSVHLCDERLEQDLSRRPRGAEGYLAVLPTRRQDRRAGRKRRRQVDLAANHGGGRAGFLRRGGGGGGGAGRLSAAGACARSEKGRLRQYHRGAR